MRAKGLHKVGTVQLGTLLQLFVSHLLVGIFVLISGGLGPLVLALGGVVGVVLTLNISSGLHLLELVLNRLAHSQPVELPLSRWRWPLTPLFVSVNTPDLSSGKPVIDQQTSAYRDQLSLQVSKTAAQEERNRLARDLHDSIKQQIFSVVVSAAAVKARWERDPAGARRTLDDIERNAQEAQIEMQVLLQELRPVALENVGLIESLRMQCQALGYRTGAQVSAELSELPSEELLPPGAQELIFRIVQEGFANIARHARAEQVWLSVRQQEHALLVEIGDDGQGFEQETQRQGYGGMGLTNIRERVRSLGGQTSIWSQIGAGTTLHLYLPLVRKLELAPPPSEDEEFQVVFKKTHTSLGVGIKAVELCVALVLLYTPAPIAFLLFSVILPVAVFACLWSQRYRVQVALSMGRSSFQHSALLAESWGLLAGILLACVPWFVYLDDVLFLYSGYAWSLLVLIGLCAVGISLAAICSFVYQERYYRLMPGNERPVLFRQSLIRLAVDFLAWILVAALTLFSTKVQVYAHPFQLNATQWITDLGLFFLLCWLLVNLLRALHLFYWRVAKGIGV